MKRSSLAALVLAALLLPSKAAACATCFGRSDSSLAEGANAGIFFLLIVILGMLAGIGAFFIYLARRSDQS